MDAGSIRTLVSESRLESSLAQSATRPKITLA
ncbi:hypothetical protein FuraDRAFT_2248 [Pseudogulbenkiania ferrooxidans 2002]|uniref:Uncharacterized protein n=1 Tax=Pseudogulbenkiania ferrooxidans 2002 TaxID=279714 RepID=B9Z4G3_9NEIS|nr:hypothetical protein FuraDRAFT_2248 [Pseudogulbenkiania ferrooxidans 2002]